MRPKRPRLWARRALGLIWLVLWGLLLWLVHRPWAGLGGIVGERLRWLERVALFVSPIVGATAGEMLRARLDARAIPPALGARWLFYPSALGAATVMLVLQWTGRAFETTIVLQAILGLLAGTGCSYLRLAAYARGEVDLGGSPARERDGRVRH